MDRNTIGLDNVLDFDLEQGSHSLEPDLSALGMRSRQLPMQMANRSEELAAIAANPADVSESILLNATAASINDFNLRTEGRVNLRGGGDLDGEPLNLDDDTRVYARRGFSFAPTPTLPVQRDSAGNPVRDAGGKPILIENAVAVSAGFTANANSNPYSNLLPPPLIPAATVTVPSFSSVRTEELAAKIPAGTPTVTFIPQQTPINTVSRWNTNFPTGGTSTNPTVVRIASGGLTIPIGVQQLRNYVIIVENGDINLTGVLQPVNLDNVVLIANNGNISLNGAQTSTNSSFLASKAIFATGAMRLNGKSLVASGGVTNFGGDVNASGASDNLRVVAQGNLFFLTTANLRGELLSAGTLNSFGKFDLFGSVGAKQDITFGGRTTITRTTAVKIAASLVNDTAANGTTNTDKITFDPRVRGTVTGNATALRAGFDSTPVASYVNILPILSNGAFTLSQAEIDRIAGGTLSNGTHTLNLLAQDGSGNQAVFAFTFTLDNQAPTVSFGLAASSDTPPVGDGRTTNGTVSLTGQTEANTSVKLLPGDVSATSNGTGGFGFDSVSLSSGANSLSVEATDIAGNVGTVTQLITRDTGSTIGQNLDLTVRPGGYLEVPLSGTDASGNRVTYRMQSTGALPTGELDGNGNLIFKPTVAEIGTYQFVLVAISADGVQEAPQTVTLRVVADPVTTTRVSGVIKNTAKQPLAGVVVEIGSLRATTAADGSFTITANGALPADTLKVRGEGLSGSVTYPFIAEKLALLLGRDIYSGVNNVIGRPIYLPPLDTANSRTVDPTVDTTVTTTAIPNASVFVKAGTLKDQSGNNFTGRLGITEVPREVTPAALPKNLIPDLVVTIQPGEMVFLQPAPLSLPNRAGYAAGTEMDLWSINPVTGNFDNVGTGRVSNDGSRIETISGGIRNSSWHFFAPPPFVPERPAPVPNNPNNPDEECDECSQKVPGGSEIDMHSGEVSETHDLITYQSLGETRGLSLSYNSMRADPRPIVHTAFSGGTAATNQQLVAKVSVQRGGFTYQVPGVSNGGFGLSGGENFWRMPTGFNSTFDVALQADMRSLPSGRYEYTMTSGILQFNSDNFAGTTSNQTGDILLVNSVNSAFGSGWGLAGLQELVPNPDGSVMLIDGDGGEMLFKASGTNTSFVSPPGDFSVLERLGNGTFRRTMKDKTVYQFDVNNRLVSMKDRNNNETRYTYNPQGQLTQVTDPVGLNTNLTYTNNKVTAITDPAGRVTRMEYNSSGDLTKVIDPDGTARMWEYDNQHHMTVEIDKRGDREEDTYDFAGRATSAKRTDGTVVRVNPLQTQGLLQSSQTINPNSAPQAAVFQNGVGTYTDSRGNNTSYTLDKRGQVVSARDGAGALPNMERNVGSNLVTSSTDARGYRTGYDYDAQGNVVGMTGGDGSQQLYAYDPAFNQVTAQTDELGRQTLYDIDPITGNVRGMTQVVGAVGGDDDLITRYTYTTQGLVDTTTDPLGRVTDYDYDAQGRQSRVTVAKGTADEASQQFVYDAAGNQIAMVDENGNRTEYAYDAMGRVVRTTMAAGTPVAGVTTTEYDADGNQVATVDENGNRTTYEYDAMDRLVKTTMAAGTADSAVMTTEYDANGNQTATVDALGRRTRYRYDARNRLTETIHPDGSSEKLAYDAGDNNTESTNARGFITRRTYDNRSRLIATTDPAGGITRFEYDLANQLIAQVDPNGNLTTYTYDELGRQVSVRDPLGNTSSTQYDKIGNTIAETDELNRTTLYTYDNRDRQIATTTPLGFTSLTTYDKVGNTIGTTDALNRTMLYVFDARNRQVEVIDPLNQSETSTYDALGNVLSTTDALGQTTRYVYDNMNRQTEVIDAIGGSTKTTYDAKDNVVAVTDPLGKVTRYGYDLRDRRTTVTDALGGVTTTTYDAVGNVLMINDPASDAPPPPPPPPPQTTTLVSVNNNFDQANSSSTESSISADGRFIAFTSSANNLVAGDTNGLPDIFVRDLQTNITTRVSVDSNGTQSNNRSSKPSISGDGRFVVFSSDANNLVTGDTNNIGDVFLRDLQTNTTTRISVDSNGNQANRLLFSDYRPSASISSDGRFVAFSSDANNLVAGDTNNSPDVFLRDLQTNTTTRVSVDSNGSQANRSSERPSISDDGRFIAFTSSSTNLGAGDTNDAEDVFVRDLLNGTTTRVGGSQQSRSTTNPSISGDGRFVAFQSTADLVPGEPPNPSIFFNIYNIFVRDLQTGNTIRVNKDLYGVGTSAASLNPSLSRDGRFITFISSNSDFNPEVRGSLDIFVRDLQTGATKRINVGSTSSGGDRTPSISSDGRIVAFSSDLNNLVADDTNSATDIFVTGPISFSDLPGSILPSATFTYDANDRLISETNASGATRTYTYDPTGNRTGITDRNGKTRRFSFDPLNRLTNEEWLSNDSPIHTINSTYDAVGQLTSITDADATYNYDYDLDGRLLSVNNAGTVDSPEVLMSYDYDDVGNVLSTNDSINGSPGGTNTYTFDPLNRVISMEQSGTDVADKRVDYTYNAVGQPTNVKRFSNLSGTQLVAETTHTFDRLNRLTNINHSRGGTPLATHTYTYDANSRITGTTNKDGTAAYSYDATDQLTGVDYSYQPDESYTYDANGNRTNPGYVTGKNNRLLSDGKFNYEYDGEGNVIRQTDILSGEVTAYTWDYRNRLTNVTRNGTSVGTYNYDVYDQRIGKTTATGTNRFVYGQNQNIALEFDGSGTLTNRYLHGNSIDDVVADEANGSVGWTLTDNLGTVRDVVDGTGASKNHFVYDSFGNVTSESDPSFDTRFTFTGREFDAETGNYDYRNRFYRPSSGRFMEEDPLGFNAGDPNLYRYVKNSPAASVDPSGLDGQILHFERQFEYTIFNPSPSIFSNTIYENDINKIGKTGSLTIRNRLYGPIAPSQIYIQSDEVKAAIMYVPTKLGPVKRTIHSNFNKLYPGDQQGHIVPDVLGGSDTSGVIDPFENNFFSQNSRVNQGTYAAFNRKVNKELTKFTGKKGFDPCKPLPPDARYITYDVSFYYKNRPQQYANYPLRPSFFDVTVKFYDVTKGEDFPKRLHATFGNP